MKRRRKRQKGKRRRKKRKGKKGWEKARDIDNERIEVERRVKDEHRRLRKK